MRCSLLPKSHTVRIMSRRVAGSKKRFQSLVFVLEYGQRHKRLCEFSVHQGSHLTTKYVSSQKEQSTRRRFYSTVHLSSIYQNKNNYNKSTHTLVSCFPLPQKRQKCPFASQKCILLSCNSSDNKSCQHFLFTSYLDVDGDSTLGAECHSDQRCHLAARDTLAVKLQTVCAC
jgi:hypothetical protein